MGRVAVTEALRHEHFDLLAEQLFACVPEDLFSLGVHDHDLALAVGHHNGIGRGFEQASKAGFGWNSVGGSRSVHSLTSRRHYKPAR